MRFTRVMVAFAAVALLALLASTSQAGNCSMKCAQMGQGSAKAGMMAPCGEHGGAPGAQMMMQGYDHPRMKMRMEKQGNCCLMHRLQREGRWQERRMGREGRHCCCCMNRMGERGEESCRMVVIDRRMMMGGPEMRGARSFSTMSFDEWLGIETGPSDRGDLTVTKILTGSPAEKAGIQPQDILTSVNGISLLASDRETLASFIQHAFADGKTVTVTALRKGKVIPIEVTLQSPKANVPPQPKMMEMEKREMETDKPHPMGR